MRARVTAVRCDRVIRDEIWKNRKAFVDSIRGMATEKIRLDVEIESPEDIEAIIGFLKNAALCMNWTIEERKSALSNFPTKENNDSIVESGR